MIWVHLPLLCWNRKALNRSLVLPVLLIWLSSLECYHSLELDEKGFYELISPSSSSSSLSSSKTNKERNGMIMFYHTWCGRCTAMKPDWDQLTEKFQSSTSVFIGRVNCSDYKELCDDHDVHTFPTIRVYYTKCRKNDENNDIDHNIILHTDEEDYREGRSFEDMFDFVDTNLMQKCTINNNIDNHNNDSCSEKAIAYIKKWNMKSSSNIQNEMERLQTIINDASSLDQRSWIRERQSLLRQLLEAKNRSGEL